MLWLLAGDARLEGARAAIEDARTPVLLSAVCVWEAAIKDALGKLRVPDDLPERLEELAFVRLPVTDVHTWAVRMLPPFTTTRSTGCSRLRRSANAPTIVSADAVFDAYAVPRLW